MFKKIKTHWENKKKVEGSFAQRLSIHRINLFRLLIITISSVVLSFLIYQKFIPSEDSRFWVLSTFVQAFAAMVALFGMLTVYKLQTVRETIRNTLNSNVFKEQKTLEVKIKHSTKIFFANSLILIGWGLVLLLFIKQDPVKSFEFTIKGFLIKNDLMNMAIYALLGWFFFSLVFFYRNIKIMISD